MAVVAAVLGWVGLLRPRHTATTSLTTLGMLAADRAAQQSAARNAMFRWRGSLGGTEVCIAGNFQCLDSEPHSSYSPAAFQRLRSAFAGMSSCVVSHMPPSGTSQANVLQAGLLLGTECPKAVSHSFLRSEPDPLQVWLVCLHPKLQCVLLFSSVRACPLQDSSSCVSGWLRLSAGCKLTATSTAVHAVLHCRAAAAV